MPRGKPKGAMVSSRSTKATEKPLFEQEEHIGRSWMRDLAQRCSIRWARGYVLDRILSTGANEYLLIWRYRNATPTT